MERYLGDVAVREGIESEVDIDVRYGSPGYELLHLEDEYPGGIIVMSTRGRSGLGRMVLGSVADHLVRHSTMPVVLIRAGTALTATEPLLNLLVTLDGSDLAEQSLPIAAVLARKSGATLHLLRVVEPLDTAPAANDPPDAIWLDPGQSARITSEMEIEARDYLRRIAMSLQDVGIDPRTSVRIGRPTEEIPHAQADTRADLVLMASHGFGGVRRWLMGSVTTSVIDHLTVPLLVVPAGVAVQEPASNVHETISGVAG